MTPPKWRALVDRVVADIDAGRLAPGAKLPSLADLAEEGISQGPALQAYRWLAAHGYVEARHGTGTFVVDAPPPPAGAPAAPSPAELAEQIAQLRAEFEAHVREHGSGGPGS